ncbi:unnamed protein product [Paramecium octaurelia]|uniref:Uncharacterized protein n=1 Tax=Paramecium octaurelia TaxID=43137 RepID=A0A8S1VSR8_PAROT|nr:unnamed protein product [Paramecium octaurelia]
MPNTAYNMNKIIQGDYQKHQIQHLTQITIQIQIINKTIDFFIHSVYDEDDLNYREHFNNLKLFYSIVHQNPNKKIQKITQYLISQIIINDLFPTDDQLFQLLMILLPLI